MSRVQISHKKPDVLQDHYDTVENLRVEKEIYPWGIIRFLNNKKNMKLNTLHLIQC